MRILKLLKPGSKTKTGANEIAAAVKAAGSCVVLDHPQQGEKITAPAYTFRIGTSGDITQVEISIDQGPWQTCRHSVGYWWYDWSSYLVGRHQAVARAKAKDGQMITLEPRKFQVMKN